MLTRIRETVLWVIRRSVPKYWLIVLLACAIGVSGGFGAVLFTRMISFFTHFSLGGFVEGPLPYWGIVFVPAIGLLFVSWFTRRFAPEAEGHGVPEVILAVARKNGVIRPRVAAVKILASAICIGTGGSVGREGPIVQIGSSLGSSAGKLFGLSTRNVKVLVACGAAAGISATFNAPLAGAVFASEIILGSFAVRGLTPIVIASVLANVVERHFGEHGLHPVFDGINYQYLGSMWQLLPYFALGLLCGLVAVWFTKTLYFVEDFARNHVPNWWTRAVVAGLIVGVFGAVYVASPPFPSAVAALASESRLPPVFGVGYAVVDHALHLENADKPSSAEVTADRPNSNPATRGHFSRLSRGQMLHELAWILPLVVLKILLTSVTLAGGGSGGIFAPSLFIGATLGAAFGLIINLLFPGISMHPGVYAIVGMGAVVAGTTHALISAMLIVYEMTNDYRIMLPIMLSAGLASVVASLIDPESIYHKKLSRRGDSLARGHELAGLEHVLVRDMMVRQFPSIKHSDTLPEILRIARAHPDYDVLPVLDDGGRVFGTILAEDLRWLLDKPITPELVRATDIAVDTPVVLAPDENILEALRDFGNDNQGLLPVEEHVNGSRRLVGMLHRADLMRRYREELLNSATRIQ